MCQNAFAAGALPGPGLGSLHRPPRWIWGRGTEKGERKGLGMERERKGKERKGREKEKTGMGMEFRGDLGEKMGRRNGKG